MSRLGVRGGVGARVHGGLLEVSNEAVQQLRPNQVEGAQERRERHLHTQGRRLDAQGCRLHTQGRRAGVQPARLETQGCRLHTQGRRVDTQGCRLHRYGCRLETQGCRLHTQGYRLGAEGCRLGAEGCRLGAEGCRLGAEGGGTCASCTAARVAGPASKKDMHTIRCIRSFSASSSSVKMKPWSRSR